MRPGLVLGGDTSASGGVGVGADSDGDAAAAVAGEEGAMGAGVTYALQWLAVKLGGDETVVSATKTLLVEVREGGRGGRQGWGQGWEPATLPARTHPLTLPARTHPLTPPPPPCSHPLCTTAALRLHLRGAGLCCALLHLAQQLAVRRGAGQGSGGWAARTHTSTRTRTHPPTHPPHTPSPTRRIRELRRKLVRAVAEQRGRAFEPSDAAKLYGMY